MKLISQASFALLLSSTLLVGCQSTIDNKIRETKENNEAAPEKSEEQIPKPNIADIKDVDFTTLSEEEKNEIIKQEKIKMQKTDQVWGTGIGYTSPDTGYTAKKYYHDPRYLAEHITNMWEGFLTGAETAETFYNMYIPYLSKKFRNTLPKEKEYVIQTFKQFRQTYAKNNGEIGLYYKSPLEWFGKDYQHIDKQIFYRMYENKWTERFYYKTTLIPKGDHWLVDNDEGIQGNSSIDKKFFNR